MNKSDSIDLHQNEDPHNLPFKTSIRWPPFTSTSFMDKFHSSVLMGKLAKIEKLLKEDGASIDVRNREGLTALFVAVVLGKKGTVFKLLELGGNPNGRCLPEGYTPTHGACYVGSVEILRGLILAGGDLRLTDTHRRKPLDWIDMQEDPVKRNATRGLIEKLRLCALKNSLEDAKKEFGVRIGIFGNGASFLGSLWGAVVGKLGARGRFICSDWWEEGTFASGFGTLYFPSGNKWSGAIGVPCLSELSDSLTFDSNHQAPSWICGKFTTFVPMVWTKKATSVTCRQLRLNTVEEAVPDILISEVECLVRLHHPRILMLMAICQEDNFDSLSLVFEKVGIGSLYFFLHQQNLRMKNTFAADIIIQIAEALDFVHGSGFIHCGISSHAIMLMEENQAKLACFEYTIPEKENASLSSSNRHPWLSADSHISCLRHWIAPEVLLRTSKPTQASDVYSLCSVMWELVIGDVPFGDCDLPNLRRLLTANAELQLPLPKDVIPPIWHRIMQVGLKRKCDERDLDITEIRYMMKLCKERLLSPSGANTSAAATSTATTGEKKTGRGTSIRSLTAAAAAAANNTGPFKVLQSTLTRQEPAETDGGKVVSLFRNCSIVSSIAKVQNTSFGSHDVN